MEKWLSVLGVCRGAQLINVYLHGSLHREILDFYEVSLLPRSVFLVKQITIETGSLLERVLKVQRCAVNALHHQAIKNIRG